jgi:hypothetical protein
VEIKIKRTFIKISNQFYPHNQYNRPILYNHIKKKQQQNLLHAEKNHKEKQEEKFKRE